VDAVRPYKVKILDTRKTAPGLRELEKYAVECGGGVNHRMGLYDQVLVKDNHIKVTSHKSQVTSLKEIITEIRKKTNKKIEIEVESLRQFKEALDGRPDIIMLDNMSISDIKKAVAFKNKLSTKLEVSGGVSLSNVRRIASTGVDMISVGALTHSAPSLDFSLEIV
jgi:nicotinate-nucleotide pyrophosphorylase (carboxylating)